MTRAATNAAFTAPSWTTANRPASPVVSQMGWNTTLGLLSVVQAELSQSQVDTLFTHSLVQAHS